MKKSNWKDTAELIGIVAIVASLIFVGYQLQLDRRIATAQLETSNFEARYAINQLISDNADIWLRANDGEELTREEALIFSNIVDSAVGRAFATAQSFDELGSSIRDINIENFAIWLYQYPAVRKIAVEGRETRRRLRNSIRDTGEGNFFWPILLRKLDELDRANAKSNQ